MTFRRISADGSSRTEGPVVSSGPIPSSSRSSSGSERFGADLCALCRGTGVPPRTVLWAGLSGASTASGERLIYLLVVAPWTKPAQRVLLALATAVATYVTSTFAGGRL